MSGFAATSGKYEVFAPGDDTEVMFNDNNDLDPIHQFFSPPSNIILLNACVCWKRNHFIRFCSIETN